MESEYAIEVFNKEFVVIFDWGHHSFNHYETITHCAIIEAPKNKIYSGSSLKNSHDLIDNMQVGRRWAYKRAVFMLWLIWTELKHTDEPFKPFWQEFRQALAKNNLYLADRREN